MLIGLSKFIIVISVLHVHEIFSIKKKCNVLRMMKIDSKFCVSQQNITDELQMFRFTTQKKSGR